VARIVARPSSLAHLASGDVGEDRDRTDPPAPPSFAARAAVAGHDAPLVGHRVRWGPIAVPAGVAGPDVSRITPERDSAARAVILLVSLVLGGRQPGDLLPLGHRQARLLCALYARHGLVDRSGVDSTGTPGARRRPRRARGPGRLAGAMGLAVR